MPTEPKNAMVVPYFDFASDGTLLGAGTFDLFKPVDPREIAASVARTEVASALHELRKAEKTGGPAMVNSDAFRKGYDDIDWDN